METEVRGRNASVTVGIFWSLRCGPLRHSFPPLPVRLVQMPKVKPLPKEPGVAAELYSSLAATCPPPKPLMKLHERESSQQGCESCRPHPALTANATQVLPGLRKQRKVTTELVKKRRRQRVRCDVSGCLHLASPPWLGALPLVPQVPRAPLPYPQVQVLPSAGLLPHFP